MSFSVSQDHICVYEPCSSVHEHNFNVAEMNIILEAQDSVHLLVPFKFRWWWKHKSLIRFYFAF